MRQLTQRWSPVNTINNKHLLIIQKLAIFVRRSLLTIDKKLDYELRLKLLSVKLGKITDQEIISSWNF